MKKISKSFLAIAMVSTALASSSHARGDDDGPAGPMGGPAGSELDSKGAPPPPPPKAQKSAAQADSSKHEADKKASAKQKNTSTVQGKDD